MSLSRRKFIQSLGALAALSAMPALLKEVHLKAQIASGGLIHNQTFYIDETIVMDIPGLIIDNCKFIVTKPLDVGILIREGTLTNCHLDSRGLCNVGIKIYPREGDMTEAFQGVVDAGSDVYLPEGTYKIKGLS